MVESVMRPLAERNGIDFSCSIDADVPLIEADFEKIRHVVENLVGNAMKFTPKGGKVRVTVSYHPECEQTWICVSDTGIGVAKADRERIFERFAQADSSFIRKYGQTWAFGWRKNASKCCGDIALSQTGARVSVYSASAIHGGKGNRDMAEPCR